MSFLHGWAALAARGTVFTTFEQTGLAGDGGELGAAWAQGVLLAPRVELWLDGGRVDSVRVEAFADVSRKGHVPVGAFTLDVEADLDVERGDELGVAELPDVEVVAADDARKLLDVLDDVVDAEAGGHGLEEDPGGGLAERDGGEEDDDGDEQGDGRVCVVAPGVVCEPDEEGRDDDADVAEGVAQDMKEDAAHVQVVAMAVAAVAAVSLLGLAMGVVVVGVGGVLGPCVVVLVVDVWTGLDRSGSVGRGGDFWGVG